jgi:hypothetical protein
MVGTRLRRLAHPTPYNLIPRTNRPAAAHRRPNPPAEIPARRSGETNYTANRTRARPCHVSLGCSECSRRAVRGRHRRGSRAPNTDAAIFPFRVWRLAWASVRIARQVAGKIVFDQAPAPGKVGIVRRQRPNGVQVVGEHADRNRLERMTLQSRCVGGAKALDMANEEIGGPVGESQGEQEPASFDPYSAVPRHSSYVTLLTFHVNKYLYFIVILLSAHARAWVGQHAEARSAKACVPTILTVKDHRWWARPLRFASLAHPTDAGSRCGG